MLARKFRLPDGSSSSENLRHQLVQVSPEITVDAINSLIDGSISALRVPDFYPLDKCHKLARWFIAHPDRALYGQNVTDQAAIGGVRYLDYHVDRIGFPRNQLIGKAPDSPEFREYFESKSRIMDAVARIAGAEHPIVQLISSCERIYPYGAKIEEINRREVFVGIGRITRPGAETLLSKFPHVDGVWPYQMHFSANVFLAAPKQGGELEVFGGPTLSAQEVASVGAEHNFRTDPNYMCSQLIKPQTGDLIIINTRRPHAVCGFEHGSRVTISSFIGLDAGQPLKFYS